MNSFFLSFPSFIETPLSFPFLHILLLMILRSKITSLFLKIEKRRLILSK